MSAQKVSQIGQTILNFLNRNSGEEVPAGFISRYEVERITGFGRNRLTKFLLKAVRMNMAEYRLFKIPRERQIRLVAHYKFSGNLAKIMGLPEGTAGIPRGISRKAPMRPPRTTTIRPTIRE